MIGRSSGPPDRYRLTLLFSAVSLDGWVDGWALGRPFSTVTQFASPALDLFWRYKFVVYPLPPTASPSPFD